jgi:hypothetical protein
MRLAVELLVLSDERADADGERGLVVAVEQAVEHSER